MVESKPNPLRVTVERSDDAVTVVVRGEVDLETSSELGAALAGVAGARELHVDLSDVDYMDSTGLRALLVAREETAEQGGTLDIVAASDIITRLIDITGLTELFAPRPAG